MEDSLADIAQHIREEREEIPKEIAGYEILGEIGRGGMGIVYRARQKMLDRVVALKLILSGGGGQEVERFIKEARSIAAFSHPNIVTVYDFGKTAENKYYLSMEYVAGKSLSSCIKEKEISVTRAIEITRDLCGALSIAHAKGIIHRDIKPSNILMDALGFPKLTDFGLAKQMSAGKFTISGTVLGTPHYMPPEQAEGRIQDIDERSDIYSLGGVLYEMITGQAPFTGDNIYAVLHKVVTQPPQTPSRIVENLRPELDEICLKALEKKSENRYANAMEFRRALETCLSLLQESQSPEMKKQDIVGRISCIQQMSPPFTIKVWVERQSSVRKLAPVRQAEAVQRVEKISCSIGDYIAIYFLADQDCYLHLLDIDPNGNISVIFPNEYHAYNKIEGNKIYRFPDEKDEFDFEINPPEGRDIIKAIATLEPVGILEELSTLEHLQTISEKDALKKVDELVKKINAISSLKDGKLGEQKGIMKWSEARCEMEITR